MRTLTQVLTVGAAGLALFAGCGSEDAPAPEAEAKAQAPKAQPEPESNDMSKMLALGDEAKDLFADIERWTVINADLGAEDLPEVCSELPTYVQKVERLEDIADELAELPNANPKLLRGVDKPIAQLDEQFDRMSEICVTS